MRLMVLCCGEMASVQSAGLGLQDPGDSVEQIEI